MCCGYYFVGRDGNLQWVPPPSWGIKDAGGRWYGGMQVNGQPMWVAEQWAYFYGTTEQAQKGLDELECREGKAVEKIQPAVVAQKMRDMAAAYAKKLCGDEEVSHEGEHKLEGEWSFVPYRPWYERPCSWVQNLWRRREG